MGKLHFSENLFIDNLELRKFNEFVFEKGWQEMIKNNAGSFGVIKNEKLDPAFSDFEITQGSPLDGEPTIVVNKGIAVSYNETTKNITTIRNTFTEPIKFPQDGKWYWVKIAPEVNTKETGVISVDTEGNLVGNGTLFTEVLRGQPNFPSKIRFYRLDKTDNLNILPSALNSLEYDVLQVIDDTNAILQGDFANETDLYYEVVGTFTPGYIVPDGDKGIFRYDGCEISIVEESSVNGEPLKPFHSIDEEFFIYRVKYESNQMLIQDFRNELFKLKAEFDIEFIKNDPIPNIGVLSSSYENANTTQTKSRVKVEWGFRSTSYDVFVNEEKITILNGKGGKFKTTNDFTNEDFNGYRLYVIDTVKNNFDDDYYSSFEKFFKINSSQKNGTSIDLLMDNFSPLDFLPQDYSSSENYKNKDKVRTTLGHHRLLLDTATGLNPVQATWNNGTIYSVNQLVTFLDGTYISLQNSNSGNAPDLEPTQWKKVWELMKPEILIVPDCEEVLLYAKVGENVSLDEPDSYEEETSSPVIFGEAILNLVGINEEGEAEQDDLIYNIQYRTKNNKVFSSRKVFPSDSVGYLDETGSLVPYDTTFIDEAYLKSIKNKEAYSIFKEKIDLGDKFGWEEVLNLEIVATQFASRIIPIVVGVVKERVIIKDSSSLTADIYINISKAGAKSGNEFEFYLEKGIDEVEQYSVHFIVGGNTSNPILTWSSELRLGDQTARFKFDLDENAWNVIYEDNAFKSFNHFTPGPSSSLRTSTHIEIAPDGKRILVVEGDSNIIKINDDAAVGDFAYIRFKNNLPINELYIARYGGSPNIDILADGQESQSTNAGNGDEKLFNFLGNDNQGTGENGIFQTLNGSEWLHMVIAKGGNQDGERQGYMLLANSNDRKAIQNSQRNTMVGFNKGWIGGLPKEDSITAGEAGVTKIYIINAKVQLHMDDNNTAGLYAEAWLKINGTTVDFSKHEFDVNGEEENSMDATCVLQYMIVKTGVFTVSMRYDTKTGQENANYRRLSIFGMELSSVSDANIEL